MPFKKLILAVLLDLIIGDPESSLHPVRLVGSFALKGERLLKKLWTPGMVQGIALYVITASLFSFLAWLMPKTPWFGPVFEVVVSSLLLSTRSLFSEVEQIFLLLKSNRIDGARKKLSHLVTRKTHGMSSEEVSSTCIETLSENFVDAILSPILYLALGGLPLLTFYKVTNTFDSLFGYRTGYLERFGKLPARMDDAMNFIPARLSLLFIWLGAWVMKYPYWNLSKKVAMDRGKRESPNSWIPESACAHAIGIELERKVVYFEESPRERPPIGSPRSRKSASKIMEAEILLSISTLIFLCSLSFLYLLKY